ncbi:MAG: CBS domain-containing protein, partial [Endomicrobiales bacterium]
MKVQDIMTRDVVTVKPDMDVRRLAQLFIEKDISGAPVVDEKGDLLGVVLEDGLILQDKNIHLPTLISILNGVFAIGEDRFESEMKKMAAITVSGIMEEKMNAISPETPVEEIATKVIEQGTHYFPVVVRGKLVGVVTKKDIVRAIAQNKIWYEIL